MVMDIQRKEFEAWAKANGYHVAKNPIGEVYLSLNCNSAWKAWQAAKANLPERFVLVPKEPTQAMLDSARDWSTKKYGKAVGNDGASGCYKAMLEAQEQNQ